jgi:hypothetical protein
MIACLVIILVILVTLVILLLRSRKERYTGNGKSGGDGELFKMWHRTLFTNMPDDVKVNYNLTLQNLDFTYIPGAVNIIIDGEPRDIRDQKADIVLSNKKELLPLNTPTIYLPQFMTHDPSLLIKGNDEVVVKDKFCCFMYSNCNEKDFSGVRDRKIFLEMMNEMSGNRVDNLGKCYNPNYKNNGTWTNNHDIYKPYKFVIAFENTQLLGYITEKLVYPMIARSIPIYLGAPDVGEHFNTRSFVNVSDFEDFKTCIDYVLEIDRDRDLYNRIMAEPYLIENRIDPDLFSLHYGGKFYRDLQEVLKPYGLDKYVRRDKLVSGLER